MKAQFIFSAIVFSSLALFSSVNFAKSSEYSGNCQIYVSKDGTEGSYLPAGFVFVTAQLNGTTIPERGDLDLSVPNVIGTTHQRWNPNEVKNLMKIPGMTVGRALTQSQFKHQKVDCPDTKGNASIEFQVKVDSIKSKTVKPGIWDLKKLKAQTAT